MINTMKTLVFVKTLRVRRHSRNAFFHFTVFGFKNAQINVFKKIRVLSAVFIELKCGWL